MEGERETAATVAEAGFETYILKRQNTVVQYIVTRSLLDLCEATERTQGARMGMQ